MKEDFGDMLEMDCDALVITTNGYVTQSGKCVMGRGIAKQIADRVPVFPYLLGSVINKEGNHVHVFPTKTKALITFPVKPKSVVNNGFNVVSHCRTSYGEITAGYHAKADINLIERSLIELVALADKHPEWKKILIPRVGCGAGELDYEKIKPLMEKYLDDRFVCCTFK